MGTTAGVPPCGAPEGDADWVAPSFLLRGFWDELHRRGVSLRELENRTGLTRPRVGDYRSTVSRQDAFRLYEAALELTGDETLGISVASALSAEGYAASASTIASGGQLCQHHCPVAHVAAEFPQLCEAETQVISRLVGTHVQRLATIAHGDGVCTTHIPPKVRPAVPTT